MTRPYKETHKRVCTICGTDYDDEKSETECPNEDCKAIWAYEYKRRDESGK